MKKLLIVISFLCVLVSCRNRSSDFPADGAEVITIPEKIDNRLLEDIAEEIRYVGLEFTEKSMLGTVARIRVFDGRIYVMDFAAPERLLVFDTDGKFIMQVSRPGRGPNEYTKMYDFEIDRVNREIIIIDRDGRRFLVYGMDGVFKYSVIPEILADAAALSGGQIMVGNDADSYSRSGDKKNGDYKIFFLDREGKVEKRLMKDDFRSLLPIHVPNYLVSLRNGNVSFAPQFHNMIYEVSRDSIRAVYRIEFEDPDAFTMDEIARMHDSSELILGERTGRPFFIGAHAISDNWLHLGLGTLDTHIFFDRNAGKLISSRDRLCGLALTIDENDGFWGTIRYVDPMFQEINETGEGPYLTEEKKAELLAPDNTSYNARAAKKIKEVTDSVNDNPVLVYYKLKK